MEIIYTETEIADKLANNEISLTESFVLTFKLKEHNKAIKAIETGIGLKLKKGKKIHHLHIKAIVDKILSKGRRLHADECEVLADEIHLNPNTVGFLSHDIAIKAFPLDHIGIKFSCKWNLSSIEFYINQYRENTIIAA